MQKELHIAIIWENARYKENEIINHISKKFEIIEKYKIKWKKKFFSKSLSSFYGTKLPRNSHKEKHCGNGEFVLLIFYDNNPKYRFIETSRGNENVNINTFEMKQKLRNLTNGGHKIHTTNSPKETNHDLTLLLGINYQDYEKLINKKLDTSDKKKKLISFLPTSVVGVDSWNSLEQLFYVMNNTIDYVVLRNFEKLPNEYRFKEHGDLDFLVANLDEAIFKTQAINVFSEENRVHYKIKVADEYILTDFRFVGDNYYDVIWQKNILKNRILSQKGFYKPCDEDYFYSLVYHVLIHKLNIADDYPDKIINIFKNLKDYNLEMCNFTSYLYLLEKYLNKNQYKYTKPIDPSVFFDHRYIDYKKDLKDLLIFELKNIRPYLVHEWKNVSKFIYFLAEKNNGEQLFIKTRGILDSARREYEIIKELRKIEPKYFPKEFYYRYTKEISCVVLEKIDGCRLDILLKSLKSKPKNYVKKLYNGLFEILVTLHKANIVHRDIRPQNIIVQNDGNPVLIDFQFAVDSKRRKYKEFKFIREKPRSIINLGREYARGCYHWDDAHSFKKIFELFKMNNDSDFLKIQNKIEEKVGLLEIISISNNIFLRYFTLLKNKLPSKNPKLSILIYKYLYFITKKEKFKKKIFKYKKFI